MRAGIINEHECTLTDSWLILFIVFFKHRFHDSRFSHNSSDDFYFVICTSNVLLLFTTKGNCIKWGPGLYCMHYGNMGCGVFKRGIQNYFFSFGLMASSQKVPKFGFQSQFSTSKIIRIFLIFFIEEHEFRSIFFIIDNFEWY